MARYIDADNIPYYLDTSEEAPIEGRMITFKADVDKLPTVDVEGVKHGEWQDTGDELLDTIYSGWKCSECGYIFCGGKFKFCPDCGAKMDGGKAE